MTTNSRVGHHRPVLLLLLLFLGTSLADYRVQLLFQDPGCNPDYTIFVAVDLVTTSPCAAVACSRFPGSIDGFAYSVKCSTVAPDVSAFPLAILRYTSTSGGRAACSSASGNQLFQIEAYRPLTSCQYYPPYSIPQAEASGASFSLSCNATGTSRYYLYRYSLPGCLLGGTLTSGVAGCTVDLVDPTEATYAMIGATCPANFAVGKFGVSALLLLAVAVVLTSRALW